MVERRLLEQVLHGSLGLVVVALGWGLVHHGVEVPLPKWRSLELLPSLPHAWVLLLVVLLLLLLLLLLHHLAS